MGVKVHIRPYRKNEGGLICLPMYRNVPDAGRARPDWQLVFCPRCGALCWESENARKALEEEKNLQAVCTACALRNGGEP